MKTWKEKALSALKKNPNGMTIGKLCRIDSRGSKKAYQAYHAALASEIKSGNVVSRMDDGYKVYQLVPTKTETAEMNEDVAAAWAQIPAVDPFTTWWNNEGPESGMITLGFDTNCEDEGVNKVREQFRKCFVAGIAVGRGTSSNGQHA